MKMPKKILCATGALVGLFVFLGITVTIESKGWYMEDGWRYRDQTKLMGLQIWESYRSDPQGLEFKEPELSYYPSTYRAFGVYCTESGREVPIKNGMTPILQKSLAGTTRIEIHGSHNEQGVRTGPRTIEEEAKIQGIIANLDVVYECNPSHCMCGGEYAIEFHSEEHLITRLTFHHLESVRTEDGAETSPGFGNLELTMKARKYFSALFASMPELTPKEVHNKMIEEDSSSW